MKINSITNIYASAQIQYARIYINYTFVGVNTPENNNNIRKNLTKIPSYRALPRDDDDDDSPLFVL